MNRKRRKLLYIRKKNGLQLGALVRDFFVATRDQLQIDGYAEAEIKKAIDVHSKKYKTPLTLHAVNVGANKDNPDLIAVKFALVKQ